jgi:hypothetical protein
MALTVIATIGNAPVLNELCGKLGDDGMR